MADYRIYTLNERGKVDRPSKEFDFPDDGAAVEKAKQFLDGQALEVWEQARLVAHLEPNKRSRQGAATTAATARPRKANRLPEPLTSETGMPV